jgi:hypothetical protein
MSLIARLGGSASFFEQLNRRHNLFPKDSFLITCEKFVRGEKLNALGHSSGMDAYKMEERLKGRH